MKNKLFELVEALPSLSLEESLEVFFNLVEDDTVAAEEIKGFFAWLLENDYGIFKYFICLETGLSLYDEEGFEIEDFQTLECAYTLLIEQISICQDKALLEEAENLLQEIEEDYPDVFDVFATSEKTSEVITETTEIVN